MPPAIEVVCTTSNAITDRSLPSISSVSRASSGLSSMIRMRAVATACAAAG